jgi:hypothetical protein
MRKHSNPKYTFQQMARLEPRLADLESMIRQHAEANRGARPYCANTAWYSDRSGDRDGAFKEQMLVLAGFHGHCKELRTMEAYEVAYEHLYSLLPDCQHDGLCGG